MNNFFSFQVRPASDYVNARSLLANTAERETLSTSHNIIVINSTSNIYVKFGDGSVTATVPSDTTDGAASELNPTAYTIPEWATHVSVISPNNCIVTFAYYRASNRTLNFIRGV